MYLLDICLVTQTTMISLRKPLFITFFYDLYFSPSHPSLHIFPILPDAVSNGTLKAAPLKFSFVTGWQIIWLQMNHSLDIGHCTS